MHSGALNTEQAAQFLGGLSTRQLLRLVAAGKLKKVKIGHRTMYRVADLERLLAKGLQTTGAKKRRATNAKA